MARCFTSWKTAILHGDDERFGDMCGPLCGMLMQILNIFNYSEYESANLWGFHA